MSGGRRCRSTGEVIEVREFGLSLQLGFWSVSLARVPMPRAVAVAVAVAVACRRAGPMRQMVPRGTHRAMRAFPVQLCHVLLPQGHDRDTQCNVRHELPHNRLHAHLYWKERHKYVTLPDNIMIYIWMNKNIPPRSLGIDTQTHTHALTHRLLVRKQSSAHSLRVGAVWGLGPGHRGVV